MHNRICLKIICFSCENFNDFFKKKAYTAAARFTSRACQMLRLVRVSQEQFMLSVLAQNHQLFRHLWFMC